MYLMNVPLTIGIFNLHVSPKLLIGFVFYVCSFLLSVFIISRMKPSVFYPVGTGSLLLLTCLFSHFFLKERIGSTQLIGIVLILAGVIVINLKR